MRLAHNTPSKWAFLIRARIPHNTPKKQKAARPKQTDETRFEGMTMQRLMIASLLLLTAACDTAGETKTTQTRLIPTNAVHWDVVAAADTAAHVNNNNLISMR